MEITNKFYLIEISEGDKSIAGKAVYEYATKKEAEASFHTKLGNAMKSNLFKRETCVVMDSFGNTFPDLTKDYIADIPEVTE